MFFAASSFDQNLGSWYIVVDGDRAISDGDLVAGTIRAQNQWLALNHDPTYGTGADQTSSTFEVINGSTVRLKPGRAVGRRRPPRHPDGRRRPPSSGPSRPRSRPPSPPPPRSPGIGPTITLNGTGQDVVAIGDPYGDPGGRVRLARRHRPAGHRLRYGRHLRPRCLHPHLLVAPTRAALAAAATRTVLVEDPPPALIVRGPSSVTLAPNSGYVERGAVCSSYLGASLPVAISGAVDTSATGTYTIQYTCEHAGFSVTHERTVTRGRADDEPPTISIRNVRPSVPAGVGSPDYGSDAACRDREDGDLTHKVAASVSFHSDGRRATITYSCTDSAGQTVSTSRVGGRRRQRAARRAHQPAGDHAPQRRRPVHREGRHLHRRPGSRPGAPGSSTTPSTPAPPANTSSSTSGVDSSGLSNSGGGVVRTVLVVAGDLPPVLSAPSKFVLAVGGPL